MAAPKPLSKEQIVAAQAKTLSNMAAARYLHVSYQHYKKWAKNYDATEEGYENIFEQHKNQSGKGIPKFALKGSSKIPLMDLLEGRVPIEHFNAREIKERVIFEGLIEEKIQNLDVSYIFRSPILKARVTGFYNAMQDQTDINFFFTESIQNADGGGTFVQEVLTGIESTRAGAEIGIEAQVTPTIKLKGAASMAQYVYTNNPNQYFTSDDFEGPKRLGDGTTKMKNLHIAGGPENAFQLGFEYRDPNFWWFGVTSNYFSNAYIDVSSLRRNDNFATDIDNIGYNDYDPATARELLQQEQFNDYTLVNVVGGKSWRIDGYYVGFFATINNVFDQRYRTGGFEDSRIADYRGMVEESNRDTPVFGNRYFFGNGTTYYLNLYVRF